MNFIVLGPKYIWQSKKVLFGECILQIMAIVAMTQYWTPNDFDQTMDAINLFNTISLLRTLRMLHLLAELK